MDIGAINMETILPLAVKYAGPFLAALIIFVCGRFITNRIARVVEHALMRAPHAHKSLSKFLASLVRYSLLCVVAIAALAVAGVDVSAMSGMVAGLGIAFAFILKDSLSDIAAGVMLILFRPFVLGDEVEIGGEKGVVTSMSLLATRLTTRDNIEIIIQNSKAWGGVVKNHSAYGKRRLDMVFGVSYDADIDATMAAIQSAAMADPRVYDEPKIWTKVVKLNDSSVDIELRMWCDYDHMRKIKMEIVQPVKAALDAAGIGIPYPHEVKIKTHVKTSKARNRIAKLKALRGT
ncbi:MAG TPA: mechanosensitive ion channel family protein [Hellea balneolensis]|uniref:Small-conductance mechanosensitive channel n=1 Tax=Hellea balneolensis TaxID=287478 RepID=A0A7C3C508_9PROT|nr:mechanosensitive ion channel family protein [Hellea balneolensis]